MGHGRIKQKNSLKKQYLKPLQDYCERLERENELLKTDPNTVAGQLIPQLRELYYQNRRLSVLAAAIMKRLDSENTGLTVAKTELDVFNGQRINIKWELPEGVEKPEEATEYTFTYELIAEPTPAAPVVQPTETPEVSAADIPECTDPNCTLPKDLKHTHDQPVEAGQTIPVPEVSNVDEPQSGKVSTVSQ